MPYEIVPEGPRDVLLLGAGFSKAASRHMPLMWELGAQVLDRLGLPATTLSLFDDNLEIWLSQISEPQPWLTETENLRNKALFLDASRAIHEIVGEAEATAIGGRVPRWLLRLAWSLSMAEAHVLTFNYDLLFERACLSVKCGHVFSELYVAPLTERTTPGKYHFLSPSPSNYPTTSVYKLHGSTNWFSRSAGQLQASGDVYLRTNSGIWATPPTFASAETLTDLDPMVIPPVSVKAGFYQPSGAMATSGSHAQDSAVPNGHRILVSGLRCSNPRIVFNQLKPRHSS